MPKELTSYICSICGKSYLSKDEAINCETKCIERIAAKSLVPAYPMVALALKDSKKNPCYFCNNIILATGKNAGRFGCSFEQKRSDLCKKEAFYHLFDPIDFDDIIDAIKGENNERS